MTSRFTTMAASSTFASFPPRPHPRKPNRLAPAPNAVSPSPIAPHAPISPRPPPRQPASAGTILLIDESHIAWTDLNNARGQMLKFLAKIPGERPCRPLQHERPWLPRSGRDHHRPRRSDARLKSFLPSAQVRQRSPGGRAPKPPVFRLHPQHQRPQLRQRQPRRRSRRPDAARRPRAAHQGRQSRRRRFYRPRPGRPPPLRHPRTQKPGLDRQRQCLRGLGGPGRRH